MKAKGNDLGRLVARIERTLGKAHPVEAGIWTYLNDGSPETEFDVIVSGEVGGASFRWSIECRHTTGRDAA